MQDVVAEIKRLRDESNLTFEDIGKNFGMSERTVRRHYYGAETARQSGAENEDWFVETTPELEANHKANAHYNFVEKTGKATRAIKTLDDLFEFLDIDPELFSIENVTTGSWQVKCKDEEVETLFKVSAKVAPVPVVSEGGLGLPKPPTVSNVAPTQPLRCLVAIPDTQHGFREGVPLHDDDFLDSALRVIEHLADEGHLETVMLCGDHLDLAPWSTKYRVTPDLHQTTNASFKALYNFLVRLKQAAKCPIDWFEGNHEQRILHFLAERAPEAWSMRDPVTGKRLFEIANLLHLDELGIEYVAPYGKRKWYFDNKLFGYHGTKHGGKLGQVFEQHLSEGAASAIFGHVHQQGILKRTLDMPGNPEHFAASPGCGCKRDGTVPAGLSTPQSWQQGLVVVWYDGERLYPELLSYQNGSIVWGGKRF